ncbi:MAG: hypothetical protein ACRELE_10310 [Gemmatimonadales bacterium]
MESYSRWHGIPKVETPCAGVDLQLIHGLLSVRLLFSEIVDGMDRDLVLTFDQPIAVTSFNEFQHPWQSETGGDVPRLTGKWADYLYPILTVTGSTWMRIAEESGRPMEGISHLRIVTLSDTVETCGIRATPLSNGSRP